MAPRLLRRDKDGQHRRWLLQRRARLSSANDAERLVLAGKLAVERHAKQAAEDGRVAGLVAEGVVEQNGA